MQLEFDFGKKEKKHVVVSLSGGMDSSTLLLRALSEYDTVTALSFDYGQKHRVELERAQSLIDYLNKNNNYSFFLLRRSWFDMIASSCLAELTREWVNGLTSVYVGKSKCTPFWTHPSLGGSNQKCKITKRIGTHVFLKDVD